MFAHCPEHRLADRVDRVLNGFAVVFREGVRDELHDGVPGCDPTRYFHLKHSARRRRWNSPGFDPKLP